MGLVPVIGDIADFLFKANARNAKLFEDYLYERAAVRAAEAEAEAAAALRAQQLEQQQQHPEQQQPPAKKGWFSRTPKGQTVIEMEPPAGHPVK